MSAPATTRSAYPAQVQDLVPQARELAEVLGRVPSRNRLMSEFRIGARKATTLRAHLTDHPTGPSETGPTGSVRPYAVPEPSGTGVGSAPVDPSTEPLPVIAPPEPADSANGADQNPVSQAGTGKGVPAAPEPVSTPANPDTTSGTEPAMTVPPAGRVPAAWPVLLLALPAFVAIWSGWVGLGSLTGFGIVHPLPGIWDSLQINTAITLPIGVETYAAYALRVWLSGAVPLRARAFAKWSALGSLALGALGQIAYHLMTAAGITAAPWWITTAVSCLPVAVLGMGAALTHLLRTPAESEAH
ncbi:ABC transporter permease [Allosaccharopolyspora coralli]|uniref:ABC transporter permease n=1 Tax=Allosaccharopolyspora coralli TaxID=2665642 RepID=A0A5Q3QE06_9PSEU|nr:ABC transporter permease [Allosaccharopolyspora coralli]QGK71606.1 ABC transporter permease [Allosaccharopolyspora coralli]